MAEQKGNKPSNFGALLGEMNSGDESNTDSKNKNVAAGTEGDSNNEDDKTGNSNTSSNSNTAQSSSSSSLKKKSTQSKKPTKKAEPETPELDMESKFLFDHGIDMKSGVEGEIDFEKWVKLVGSNWQKEIVGDRAKQLRVSDENMKFMKLIAETTGISMTQALNNMLSFNRYHYKDFVRKLNKKRDMEL